MSHAATKSTIKPGLDCYLLSIPPARLQAFLGHDPRSQYWKTLPPWHKDIYETKQRATIKARIDALDTYIRERVMDPVKFGAFPPISVIQFEPFAEGQLQDLHNGAFVIDDDAAENNRVLIDGLARVTAVQAVREQLQNENLEAYRLLSSYRFSVALYVPTEKAVGPDIAGQLFTDFNSYAWPVPLAKALANDAFNPYKVVATVVDESDVLRRYGGLKVGSANLGKKDTDFTTELTMAQFCKIAIEGRRGYGKLTKPVSNPNIAKLNPKETGERIAGFLTAFEHAVGRERFGDRSQLFRTAHGLYALAVIANDVLFERRTSLEEAVNGLASMDWTWKNPTFRAGIGRQVPDKRGVDQWKLNTGMATFDWLVKTCRDVCNVAVTQAA